MARNVGDGGGNRRPGIRGSTPRSTSRSSWVSGSGGGVSSRSAGGRPVELRRAYCSGNDRDVPVLVQRSFHAGGTPSPHDAEKLICLDYGVRCTGHMCPLFSVPEGEELELAASVRPGFDGERAP